MSNFIIYFRYRTYEVGVDQTDEKLGLRKDKDKGMRWSTLFTTICHPIKLKACFYNDPFNDHLVITAMVNLGENDTNAAKKTIDVIMDYRYLKHKGWLAVSWMEKE